ncbi:MAG: hypothetical protein SFW35_13140 [Chitinophagales bacterium]|nr:hypothetical protein [Chitinophagales bacterium]
MKRIALVTCEEMPDLYEDDRLLQFALQQRGVDAVPVVWDDDKVDWKSFDAVVIRNTWDYFKKYPAFLQWMDYLEKIEATVWNPIKLARWNTNKSYLQELEHAGVNIVPTFWVEQEKRPPYLLDIMEAQGWLEAVVKPTISGGAYLTERVHITEAEAKQESLELILRHGPAMVQPFLPEIETEGEYSFIFFGNEFEFAILKKPASNDFRVQLEFGGSVEVIQPSEHLLKQASKAIQVLEYPLLFARVDGVLLNGNFHLMELELVEPSLSFGYHHGAADKLADVLLAYMA